MKTLSTRVILDCLKTCIDNKGYKVVIVTEDVKDIESSISTILGIDELHHSERGNIDVRLYLKSGSLINITKPRSCKRIRYNDVILDPNLTDRQYASLICAPMEFPYKEYLRLREETK